MKKIFFLLAFTGILFSSCKKEDCPEPVVPVVQKKLMVYVKQFPATEDVIYINITKSTGEEWDGLTQTAYGNAPSCGASGTFTIDVIAGGVYSVYASAVTSTWGPTNYTITSDCTAVPIQ